MATARDPIAMLVIPSTPMKFVAICAVAATVTTPLEVDCALT